MMKLSLLVLTAAMALPTLARADIPPPPDRVETCTVAQQSTTGRTCLPCRASFRDRGEHCAKEVGEGFTRACRSWGASVWTEIWCRDEAGADAGAGPVRCDDEDADQEADDEPPSERALISGAADAPNGESGEGREPRASGGCSALDGAASSSTGLLLVAAWLGSRLRRRRAR